MTFEEAGQRVVQLSNRYKDSVPEDKEMNHKFLISAGKQYINKCNALLEKNAKMLELGYVDEVYAEFVEAKVEEEKAKTEFTMFPYLEDGAIAIALNIAYKELEYLSMELYNKVFIPSLGKGLNAMERKFILKRLNRYTLLHEDAVEFRQLESASFGMEEMDRFPQIKFKFANKWVEKGKQFDCQVYYYKNKPVAAIAHSRVAVEDGGEAFLVECMVCDSKFKKHEDYYTACMATKKQLTHPAVSRILKKLKEEWKRELEKQKREAAESVEDAYTNNSFDNKLEYIAECVNHDIIDERQAEIYRVQILRSEFKI